VVHQAIDERRGHHGVAQDLPPLLEAPVGGHDDRAPLVAAGHQREEQVGRLALKGQVADLIHDEDVVALEAAQLDLERVPVLGGLQAGHPVGRRGEGHPVPRLAGLDAERDGQVGLARARGPEEADVGRLGDPGEPGQVLHQRSLGRGLGGPVEVLERLQGWEARGADPLARPRGVAGEHLGLQQRLQEALVRPALGAGALCRGLKALAHARRLELGHQVGQALAAARAHCTSSA
jgi:stage V sporulation protein SpoVS